MLRNILLAISLIASLNSAEAKVSTKRSFVLQPSTILVAGPGTILSVHQLNMPFTGRYFAVKFKIDGGESIEVWTPDNGILLLRGMHGKLTYSRHPERILSFVQDGRSGGLINFAPSDKSQGNRVGTNY